MGVEVTESVENTLHQTPKVRAPCLTLPFPSSLRETPFRTSGDGNGLRHDP